MVTNLQILSDLRIMRDNNQPAELMNVYKGVPFVCKGRILEFVDERVRIQVEAAELVCLLAERSTRILGNEYFEPSFAEVESVDLTSGLVTLQNFSYIGTKLGERMIVRVEPKQPVPMLIHTEVHPALGEMIDISMSGLGVRIPADQYRSVLKPGSAVRVTTTLPNGEINLDGFVLTATAHPETCRLAVRFTADHEYKAIIYRYLVDRRGEIEADLRREYAGLRSAAVRNTENH